MGTCCKEMEQASMSKELKETRFIKKKNELISSLMGKTITYVGVCPASYPSQDEIGSIYLTFSDGTKQSIECSGDGGCYECDPDGMNAHWLEV